MHLSWLGLSAFKLETSQAVVVTDPYAPSVTTKPLRAKADIVTVSNPRSSAHGYLDGISGAPFIIDHPGEYEVKGVFVQGLEAQPRVGTARPAAKRGRLRNAEEAPPNGTTMYTVDLEDLRLAHLGDVREVPSDDTLERLGDIDVLFLPVGGGSTLDPEAAMQVVNAVEPLVVVPMHFEQKGLKLSGKLLPAAAFLREIGASKVEPVERVSLKRRDLAEEETKVILFAG